uniref:Bacteriophage Mu Gam like protein n=1 Tax=Serratia marcescens TaxID=615 RepID=A0A1C3HHJ6_SERMA|nr:Bacteriophage Mu Gam like protein [Serratia marcescens]
MAKGKKSLKAAAASYAPQTRDEVISGIKQIGDIQREITRIETEMNDCIGRITNQHAPVIEALSAQLSTLQAGVQAWCEVNRDTLTQGGKTKTANLITGEVSWRKGNPSVTIKGAEVVMETLKRLKLTRFILTKESINKNAILSDKNAVKDIKGIVINDGKEVFNIAPFEQEVSK